MNTNSLKLDLALEYRWASFHHSENISVVYQSGRATDFDIPPPPETQGNQGFRKWRLKVSVIYRVTDTDKLRDFVRKIFGS